MSGPKSIIITDFNPRAPRGARLGLYRSSRRDTPISIHALREERDAFSDPHHKGKDISIHALREERDYAELIRKGLKTIISIHALREERDKFEGAHEAHNTISIHALREERDWILPSVTPIRAKFQSTRSARSATTSCKSACFHPNQFQSTRSARSATQKSDLQPSHEQISIHALREERDDAGITLSGDGILDFNPRAPRGARHFLVIRQFLLHQFQSTRSARSATILIHKLVNSKIISIHALREERDFQGVGQMLLLSENFNPRAPRGARPT